MCNIDFLNYRNLLRMNANANLDINPIPAKDGGSGGVGGGLVKLTPRPNSLKYLKNNLSY